MIGRLSALGLWPFPYEPGNHPDSLYPHYGDGGQHIPARLPYSFYDRPFKIQFFRETCRVINMALWGKCTLCEPYLFQFLFRKAGNGFHDWITNEVSPVLFAIDYHIVGIEMKTVFIREIGKIIYPNL